MCNIDFYENATNVYRTKHYIVRQIMTYENHSRLDNIVISQDTFYKRTKLRDKQYEKLFADKVNLNGRRMKTASYSREYVN